MLQLNLKNRSRRANATDDERTDTGLARFAVSSIPINQQTQVKLSDGMPVPMNTLTFDGKPVALAGSYPKIRRMRWKRSMKMLLEKECSCTSGVNVGRSDAGKTITTLFQRELHLWRGAYQQPKSELSQSGEAIDQYNMQLSCGKSGIQSRYCM